MARLIIGCGYLGARVARRWLAAGQTVFGLTRSEGHASDLRHQGIRPIVADVSDPETLTGLPEAETVVFSVGYDSASGATRRQVHVQGLQAVLDAMREGIQRFLFISSTSVYGPGDGSWLNEETPCRAEAETGRVLLEAEALLAKHRLGDRAIVLRLAGIYGPGRIEQRVHRIAGTDVPADGKGYVNLIHVDDAAAVVLAAEARAVPPRTYVVADGHPVAREDFYCLATKLLGLPAPRFVGPPPSGDPSRWEANKRVDNTRMRTELAVRLQYPTYREGLTAILDVGNALRGVP